MLYIRFIHAFEWAMTGGKGLENTRLSDQKEVKIMKFKTN